MIKIQPNKIYKFGVSRVSRLYFGGKERFFVLNSTVNQMRVQLYYYEDGLNYSLVYHPRFRDDSPRYIIGKVKSIYTKVDKLSDTSFYELIFYNDENLRPLL
jgi:hypothetical protein